MTAGDSFGDYKVVRRLGKGGMGEVWLLQSASGGLVAAKILDPETAADHEARKRFLREAELALGVKHPNLVETYDVGEDPDTGLCYILMEYVPGGTLADYIKTNGALAIDDAVAVVEAMAGVLELGRQKGIVHRDIKPANIMFASDGTPKLADLGIARGGIGGGMNTTTVTQTGMMIGTPAYMSPEQMLDAHNVDTRADIYSLGVVFFEMLTGERPNKDDTIVQLMAKAVKGEPLPDVRTLRPEVSASLAQLLNMMVAPDKDGRISTPGQITNALAIIERGGELVGEASLPRQNKDASNSTRARQDASPTGRATSMKSPETVESKSGFPWKAVIPIGLLAGLAAAFWLLAPKQKHDVRSIVMTNVIERVVEKEKVIKLSSAVVTNAVEKRIEITNNVAHTLKTTIDAQNHRSARTHVATFAVRPFSGGEWKIKSVFFDGVKRLGFDDWNSRQSLGFELSDQEGALLVSSSHPSSSYGDYGFITTNVIDNMIATGVIPTPVALVPHDGKVRFSPGRMYRFCGLRWRIDMLIAFLDCGEKSSFDVATNIKDPRFAVCVADGLGSAGKEAAQGVRTLAQAAEKYLGTPFYRANGSGVKHVFNIGKGDDFRETGGDFFTWSGADFGCQGENTLLRFREKILDALISVGADTWHEPRGFDSHLRGWVVLKVLADLGDENARNILNSGNATNPDWWWRFLGFMKDVESKHPDFLRKYFDTRYQKILDGKHGAMSEADMLHLMGLAAGENLTDVWHRYGFEATDASDGKIKTAKGMVDPESFRDPDATRETQKAFDALFPGWKVSGIQQRDITDAPWAVGYQKSWRGRNDVVTTMPKTEDAPCILSRTVKLDMKRPVLAIEVASQNVDVDFLLSVKINGKVVLGPRLICTPDDSPYERILVPLSQWKGKNAKIEIEQTCNNWFYEYAFWGRLEIVEGTGKETCGPVGIASTEVFPRANLENKKWMKRTPWAYTVREPPVNWKDADFDDSKWKHTKKALGYGRGPAMKVADVWQGERIWLRRKFQWSDTHPVYKAVFDLYYDQDIDIYLNGVKVRDLGGWNTSWFPHAAWTKAFASALRQGENVLAFTLRGEKGDGTANYFDCGLTIETRDNGEIAPRADKGVSRKATVPEEKFADRDSTRRVQKTLDVLFPGWKTSKNAPRAVHANEQIGYVPMACRRANVLATLPCSLRDPVRLSRTMVLPKNAKLSFAVRKNPTAGGGFVIQVFANGQCRWKGLVNEGKWLEQDVDLSDLSGKKALLEIRHVAHPDYGNARALWARIEVK